MLDRMVIFGGTGDLTARLLAPALVELLAAGDVPTSLAVTGVGQDDWSDEEFGSFLAEALDEHAPDAEADAREALLDGARYVQADVTEADQVADAVAGDEPLVAYLALPPSLFRATLEALADAGLPAGSVVAVEKPFGSGLEEARELNELLAARFHGVTVFRNDHFLHNQTVQNLLGLRFANRLLEPVWTSQQVTAVDLRWDETLTLEGRAGYYDHTGALRDMLQNHLLQVLCFAAMEPPASMEGVDLHLARQQVLRTVVTPDARRIAEHTLRARYTAGDVDGRAVPDYTEEEGVDPTRHTETFAQVSLELDSWRWHGVPFTLRSGKALAQDTAEVVVTFADVPHRTFATQDGCEPNQLRIGIRPASLRLDLNVNAEGDLFGLTGVGLSTALPRPRLSAYAGLIRDVLEGDTTLSVSAREAEEGWRIMEPVVEAWDADLVPMREYTAGAPLPDGFTTR